MSAVTFGRLYVVLLRNFAVVRHTSAGAGDGAHGGSAGGDDGGDGDGGGDYVERLASRQAAAPAAGRARATDDRRAHAHRRRMDGV